MPPGRRLASDLVTSGVACTALTAITICCVPLSSGGGGASMSSGVKAISSTPPLASTMGAYSLAACEQKPGARSEKV
ncbi:hypothetical protein PspLS_10433 [Pyricularia sp. CBS 133598]|nr:hypothetical protein PspLS_10433 [Pyricularia sp. CBS 133598]